MPVGLAAEDGHRPVELLDQDEPREAGREGQRREAPPVVRGPHDLAWKPVGPADQEGDDALAARSEALEIAGEDLAREGSTGGLEGDHRRAGDGPGEGRLELARR